jgi:ubiquinone biosynthesis protein Coq4
VKNLASFAGIIKNEEVATRYRSLEGYPEGTLGRALFDFYTSNGFRFPGEKHGSPETLLVHDLSHILSGNGTDFEGESRTLAFQAGYRREDPFAILVFLLIQANHGVRLTPFAEARSGLFEKPGLIDDVVRSFARGNRVSADLMAGWRFWPLLDKPIEEVRKRYGIEPWQGAS